MKKIGEYTARGFVPNGTEERITLWDGSSETGYRITKFVIYIYDPDNSGTDGYGILATEPNMGTEWLATDGSQIAWASMPSNGSATGPPGEPFNLVDRDNLVVEDLYIYAEMNAAGAGMNYYIEMDKYEITDWEGAYALARNRAS
tara:strand:- start:55 stop:489 length:435 start_codon:yes stop_codon:yes gene_type:complete